MDSPGRKERCYKLLGQASAAEDRPRQTAELLPTAGTHTGVSRAVSLRALPAFSALTACVLLAAGCKPVGPDYKRPQFTAPDAYKETGASNVVPPPTPATANGGSWSTASPSDGMLKGKWWEAFNDPQLNSLEERIAAVNVSLKQAYDNYLAAKEQVKIARAAFSPTLSAGPGYSRDRVSAHRPLIVPGQPVETTYNDFTLEGQASWEPDLWGQIRRTVEAARAEAQSTNAQMANLELSLESEMAEDYFDLRGMDEQAFLLKVDVVQLTDQLDLTKRRRNGGVATEADVAQAQTQLDQTKAQLVDVGIARAEYEHAIGTIANYDLSKFEIAFDKLPMDLDPPKIPTGVPSQLLERRPDIAQAERQVAQANAQVGVAISAFYPNITLSGSGGFESTGAGVWFQGPSSLWSLGAQATELLIDGGRRKAVTRQARDNFDASANGYKSTVFQAFNEVEDKLSDLRIEEQEEAAEHLAVGDAQHSLDVSNQRYKGGVTTYLEVLTAENTLIQNQRTEAQLRSRRFASSVELIRALGGGWDATQLPK